MLKLLVQGSSFAYFIVQTLKDMYFGIIQFNKELWKNVKSNLLMFFKSYLCPILLGIREIYVCRKCNNVLRNQEEINENEED